MGLFNQCFPISLLISHNISKLWLWGATKSEQEKKGNQTALTVSASTSEWLKTVSSWPLGDLFSLSLVLQSIDQATKMPIPALYEAYGQVKHAQHTALDMPWRSTLKQSSARRLDMQDRPTKQHGWGLVAWKKHLVPQGNSRKTNIRPEGKKHSWSRKTIQLLLSPLSRSPNRSV